MDEARLKRKLRELKKAEGKIRFGHIPGTSARQYVWDEYFSTKLSDDRGMKYPFAVLIHCDRQTLRKIIEEYFTSVYCRRYRETGLEFDEARDAGDLAWFGLQSDAGIDEIKRRFRELAKKHHPDLGGSNEEMTEVLSAYKKLLRRD